ncbi:ABC transporter substrate-binding protein [Allokutzneria albata]|uniref:Amino acid/amide ABC transporter substrate-binding protein, HAAT family n=1 Tax=Allokutzneria albata TaxID=211114 RepID=A0A1G9UUZ3_ALLAB|nr:ABC transporter substrate-binding protein [Allokutzneria albata]SDM63761.1 amino acid/amide ABC transporter substrate-binding protein, HAAT family [Allokutzneria albata]
MSHRGRIGVVLARTGRLTLLGDPLDYVVHRFRGLFPALEFVTADSRSTVEGARAATRRLVETDGVRVVVCLGGTSVLPAITETCELLRTPCVSTALPWQVYRYGRDRDFDWTYHFCWGLDDIAATFADLWCRAGNSVGLLWNDGPQGRALRDPDFGFLPVRSHAVVDAGAYRESESDFAQQVDVLRWSDVDIVTSAATTGDLVRFLARAREAGLRPNLVTCSRWLAYPFGMDDPALDRVATVVAWAPQHRYTSSVDGTSAVRLGEDYLRETGRPWLPLLGLAHALLEVAVHAVTTGEDRDAVADVLAKTTVDTIAGRLDWTSGPVPCVATLPLAAGQWQNRVLRVVDNEKVPAAVRDGDLVLGVRN